MKSTPGAAPKQAAGAIVPSPLPGLLAHHVDALHARGLTDDTIRAAGIYSEADKTKLAGILDTKRISFKSAALIIPYSGIDGANGYARVRPDNPRQFQKKPVKYESPRGRRNQIYFPPGVAALVADIGQAIIITEGEFKALASTQNGFACVGLVGVFGWAEKNRESLLAELERIDWKGRLAYIAYDSDISEKSEVQDAEARLAAHLTNRGATVKAVRIPAGPPDADGKPTKLGLDDYLAIQDDPKRAMRDLLDKAEDPPPPKSIDVRKRGNEIDSTREGPKFIDATKLDGVPRLRFWRGTWLYWQDGAYREHQPPEVRARLVEMLMRDFYGIAQSHTGNVLDVAKAVAILPFSTEPPAWIGGAGPWPADELLVAKNGIVHLPSMAEGNADYLRPLTARLFTQNALDYDFNIDAPATEAWLTFLSQLWPDDPESTALLQNWFGYCLTPDTRQQKILMLVGPKRSGKGTIARVIRALIGVANCCGPTLASLGGNFGLSPLLGKALAIVSDARLGRGTDSQVVVERLLSISGEDALSVDRKFLDSVTVKLPTRLMLISNELPRLGDSSGALAGRILLLRLRQSFYGREDHGLTDKLLAELPGILVWAIQGWVALRHRGRFVQPLSAADLLNDLRTISSPIAEFIDDCCDVGPEHTVRCDDLYAAYLAWCKEKGRNHPEDAAGFGRNLHAALPDLTKSQPRVDGARIRSYVGIGLAGQCGSTNF
jgi:putative DNA primase/helicase